MRFKKITLTLFVLVLCGYIYNQKFNNKTINFERFNIISTGVIRTPDERFDNLKKIQTRENV